MLSLNNFNAFVISLFEQYLIFNVVTVLKNLWKKNRLLSINQLHERKIAIVMFKNHNLTLPLALQDLFQLKPSRFVAYLEAITKLFLHRFEPCCVTNPKNSSVQTNGISYQTQLENAKTLISFKTKLEEFHLRYCCS